MAGIQVIYQDFAVFPNLTVMENLALNTELAAKRKIVSKKRMRQIAEEAIAKIDFKVDKTGIVHTSIGKVSFSAEKIADNARAFIATIIKLKPATAKGTYMKSIFISSTMSRGIKIDPKSIDAKN